jgi:hypothetical protein
MRMLEELFNELSDLDMGWWPFLFLRPARDARMTSDRCLLLAALYGVFLGLFLNILMRFARVEDQVHPMVLPLALTAVMFVLHRLTFAYFWNRRADRLSHAKARMDAWRSLADEELDGSGEDS